MQVQKKSSIRERNIEQILLAAEQVFADRGYAGARMSDIAQAAALPRSNVHYYFSTKQQLYREVLFGLLELWKQDALCFELYDDPRVVLTTYIRAKMNRSRTRPAGSRVWASEIMHRAPVLGDALEEHLVGWARMKEARIASWVAEGRISPVAPAHLLFMVWSATQHYADFDYQIELINNDTPLSDHQFELAVHTVTQVILRGVGLST
ncbi:TetR/AcrR family transcriptional regulator [Larsenimonas rhizosphaerae]|uniref:TetR/AcrR family transcriptional regulator n=1 Tax=Larsenimonas rhizosphaerae TaxID=2944682 RepID=A0AA42CTE8_9GAMM|nr:TetR/AcrR family transcriptional regulator [Larsenimonas rhizosphaerae]MCX2522981.1 TetR/AcrR family transcriptional regulator [Larsenimonas rhizosphaerae]